MRRPCFVFVRPRLRPSSAITNATAIIATITVTIMPPSSPAVRERGAGGSCAGKSVAIRALHSIWRGHGPVTDQTPAVPRSAPSWCGAITSGKLSAMKTASGSSRAVTTATLYGPGPDPSQAPSHSGAPEPSRLSGALRELDRRYRGRLRAAFLLDELGTWRPTPATRHQSPA